MSPTTSGMTFICVTRCIWSRGRKGQFGEEKEKGRTRGTDEDSEVAFVSPCSLGEVPVDGLGEVGCGNQSECQPALSL